MKDRRVKNEYMYTNDIRKDVSINQTVCLQFSKQVSFQRKCFETVLFSFRCESGCTSQGIVFRTSSMKRIVTFQ